MAVATVLCLAACGGGDAPPLDVPTTPRTGAVTPSAQAEVGAPVLDAPPGLPLASSLRDYVAPVSPSASAGGPATASAARFVVTVLPTVTVGEVSRALLAAGTRIVEMRAHDLTFSIESTGGGSNQVRDRVVSDLEASRLFESVLPVN